MNRWDVPFFIIAIPGLPWSILKLFDALRDSDTPEFEPYTGDILYAENIQPTQRTEGQAENIRLVINF